MEDIKGTINKIIDIDNKTKELIINTNKLIEEENDKLTQTITMLDEQIMTKAKTTANDKYNEIIKKLDNETKRLKLSYEKELNNINTIYLNKKEEILNTIFKKFVLNEDKE